MRYELVFYRITKYHSQTVYEYLHVVYKVFVLFFCFVFFNH